MKNIFSYVAEVTVLILYGRTFTRAVDEVEVERANAASGFKSGVPNLRKEEKNSV